MVLYANTRAEWMISAIGAFKHSLAIVTIYTNLGEDGVQHGITQVSFYSSLCFWQVLIMIQLEGRIMKIKNFKIYSNNQWVFSKKLYLRLIDLETALYHKKEKT